MKKLNVRSPPSACRNKQGHWYGHGMIRPVSKEAHHVSYGQYYPLRFAERFAVLCCAALRCAVSCTVLRCAVLCCALRVVCCVLCVASLPRGC
jgi:hypothetical protein